MKKLIIAAALLSSLSLPALATPTGITKETTKEYLTHLKVCKPYQYTSKQGPFTVTTKIIEKKGDRCLVTESGFGAVTLECLHGQDYINALEANLNNPSAKGLKKATNLQEKNCTGYYLNPMTGQKVKM